MKRTLTPVSPAIVPQGGAGNPETDPRTLGARDCRPFPWQEGLTEGQLAINNEEYKDVQVEFIGAIV